jgi:protein-tyrosine-phosphatase
MKKVIFICKGNMHRSPISAALFNLLKKDNSFAESYGTRVEFEGRTGEKLSSFPSLVVYLNELKNKYGIDISNHICKQVTPQVLEGADRIIMIAQDYSIPDWLREYKYVKWELPDPDYATEEDASKDIQGIKKKVESLL